MTFVFLAVFLFALWLGYLLGLMKGRSMGPYSKGGNRPCKRYWVWCFSFSAVFGVFALIESVSSLLFLANSEVTEGVVTEMVEELNIEGDLSYTSVYGYTLKNGESISSKTDESSFKTFQVGDVVQVRYLKKHPDESRIDSFGNHWGGVIALSVVSLGLGGVGWVLKRRYYRKTSLK